MTRFPVENTHALMFDRAVGRRTSSDGQEVHGESSRTVAPTFLQALAHFTEAFPPTREIRWTGTDQPVSIESSPPEQELAAEQHFEFFRHVRVGDVLQASSRRGNSWTRRSRSGASLAFEERIVDYRDETGTLVATATAVVVIVGAEPGERRRRAGRTSAPSRENVGAEPGERVD